MRLWLVLPLLLAGCGILGPRSSSPQAECEWQANSDPKVESLSLQEFNRNTQSPDLRPDIAVAKHEATVRCLQARGLVPPGGVQPVRPAY
jgi:hypothetical protein